MIDHQTLIQQLAELPPDRATARSMGSRTYAPIRPCRNGHLAPLETHFRRCTQCVTEAKAKTAQARWKAQSDARKVARMVIEKAAVREATALARKEAKKAERLAAKEAEQQAKQAAAREASKTKAAATRAANKAAKQGPAPAPIVAPMEVDDVSSYAVREVGLEGDGWGDDAPWGRSCPVDFAG